MYDLAHHMEPMLPKEDKALVDLAMRVHTRSAALGSRLHLRTRIEITKLLRHINSYYSNRIEGQHTTPADIEKAVKNDFSRDENILKLQKLNKAHIDVQALIDQRLDNHPETDVCSKEFLCWIHREFYNRIPTSFLMVHDPASNTPIEMEPGNLRDREVTVGNHLAPKAEALDTLLESFRKAYDLNLIYGHKALLAAAASHHRLAWIHPFLDGNGRVTRLFSYAYMKQIHIESYGLWTLSRGFARRSDDYKRFLAIADSPRQGDLDGRGNLSEKGLRSFCTYFLDTALDQIQFMNELLELENMRKRIHGYVHLRSREMIPDEQPLRPEAAHILSEIMTRGEVARGEVQRVTGLGERTARDLTSQLVQEELVVSDSHKSPLRFHIPTKVVGYYFPALYPEGSI